MHERDLRALLTLQVVSRSNGFAAAARELGSTRAAVSRVIAEAERRIGVRLCHRTTRRVALTEAAEQLLREAEPHLQAVQAAWSSLPDRQGRFQGLIRLSCSHAFGRAFVLPVLQRFRDQHPAVRFDLRLGDAIDDMVSRALDVAVRIGPLPDSSLVARRIGRIGVVLAAAPSLIEPLRRAPRTIAEVMALPVLAFQAPGSGLRRAWVTEGPAGPAVHEVPSPCVVLDSIEGLADLVRGGAGVGLVPRYLVADDLRQRRLVPLLKSQAFVGPEVHVCYAHRELMPQRIRALVDMLVAEVGPALAG